MHAPQLSQLNSVQWAHSMQQVTARVPIPSTQSAFSAAVCGLFAYIASDSSERSPTHHATYMLA